MVCFEGNLPERTCSSGAAGGAGNQDLRPFEEGQKDGQRTPGLESGGGTAQLYFRLFEPQKDKGYKDNLYIPHRIMENSGIETSNNVFGYWLSSPGVAYYEKKAR